MNEVETTLSSPHSSNTHVMRCASCSFYTPKDGLHGSCHHDKFYQGYWAKWVDYGTPKVAGDRKYPIEPDFCEVEGDEGWGFRVGKDFGCVHWHSA